MGLFRTVRQWFRPKDTPADRDTTPTEPPKRTAEELRQAYGPWTTEEVLAREFRAVGAGSAIKSEAPTVEETFGAGLTALCLSGGGIRSGAFALGVLQGLARKTLLTKIHYLSTVSGGGYIGAWLSALIFHKKGKVDEVETLLGESEEIPEIRRLRERTNFLTPSKSPLSIDTLTAVVTVVRNLSLNWLLFIPVIWLLVFVMKLLPAVTRFLDHHASGAGWGLLSPAAGLTLIVTILSVALTYLVYRALPGRGWDPDDRTIGGAVALPTLVWAVTLSWAVETAIAGGWFELPLWRLDVPIPVLLSWVGTLVGYRLGMGEVSRVVNIRQPRGSFVAWIGSSIAAHIGLAAGLPEMREIPTLLQSSGLSVTGDQGRWSLFLLVAPIFALMTNLAGIALYAGFRGRDDSSDSAKEWLARLSAMKLRFGLFYGAAVLAALVLPAMPGLFDPGSKTSIFGIAAGFVATFTAWSPLTKIGVQLTGMSRIPAVPVRLLIGVATFCFLLVVIGVCARLQDNLAASILQQPDSCESAGPSTAPEVKSGWLLCSALTSAPNARAECIVKPVPATPPGQPCPESRQDRTTDGICDFLVGYGLPAAGAAILLFLSGTRINPNRFSLHGFYRNRLVREFLGSARNGTPPQTPAYDGFFHEILRVLFRQGPRPSRNIWEGNVSLCRTFARHRPRRLFHVVNCTLNLSKSNRLDWQDRKGAPFTMSPLACGSDALHTASAPAPKRDGNKGPTPSGAFVCSRRYSRSRSRSEARSNPDWGITLGTAMTVSGAAASPNMGYYTSSATAVLLTLFNLRLGAWLPNPAKVKDGVPNCTRFGPSFAVWPYLREMIGLVGSDGSDLYLSDGGHFENLGLYEMIRRRCRYIIVADAGNDPTFGYGDLANTIRKVWIDFQVEIRLPVEQIKPAAETGRVEASWVVGKIVYPPGKDFTPESSRTGELLYIKTSLPTDLPADLIGYAALNKHFPNDSTADQWFDEAQFESYRHLGFHIANSIGPEDQAYAGMQAFFAAAIAEAAARTRPSRKRDGSSRLPLMRRRASP